MSSGRAALDQPVLIQLTDSNVALFRHRRQNRCHPLPTCVTSSSQKASSAGSTEPNTNGPAGVVIAKAAKKLGLNLQLR